MNLIAPDAYLARGFTPSPSGGGRGWGPAALASSASVPNASGPPSQPSPRGACVCTHLLTAPIRLVKGRFLLPSPLAGEGLGERGRWQHLAYSPLSPTLSRKGRGSANQRQTSVVRYQKKMCAYISPQGEREPPRAQPTATAAPLPPRGGGAGGEGAMPARTRTGYFNKNRL